MTRTIRVLLQAVPSIVVAAGGWCQTVTAPLSKDGMKMRC